MSNLTSRWHQVLIGRMVLYVIVPTGLILAFVICLAASRNFDRLRQLGEEHLQAETALAALEDRSAEPQRGPILSTDGRSPNGRHVRATKGLARFRPGRARRHTPDITAAYFGYEPNADQQDAASLGSLPAESMDQAGRFIPYWFRALSRGNRPELEPLVDMESSLYYDGAKKAFQQTGKAAPMITEPYVYQGKMIVEQTYPIIIEKQFKGVAGVDRALTDVEANLRQRAKECAERSVPDQLPGQVPRRNHRCSSRGGRRPPRAAQDPRDRGNRVPGRVWPPAGKGCRVGGRSSAAADGG